MKCATVSGKQGPVDLCFVFALSQTVSLTCWHLLLCCFVSSVDCCSFSSSSMLTFYHVVMFLAQWVMWYSTLKAMGKISVIETPWIVFLCTCRTEYGSVQQGFSSVAVIFSLFLTLSIAARSGDAALVSQSQALHQFLVSSAQNSVSQVQQGSTAAEALPSSPDLAPWKMSSSLASVLVKQHQSLGEYVCVLVCRGKERRSQKIWLLLRVSRGNMRSSYSKKLTLDLNVLSTLWAKMSLLVSSFELYSCISCCSTSTSFVVSRGWISATQAWKSSCSKLIFHRTDYQNLILLLSWARLICYQQAIYFCAKLCLCGTTLCFERQVQIMRPKLHWGSSESQIWKWIWIVVWLANYSLNLTKLDEDPPWEILF